MIKKIVIPIVILVFALIVGLLFLNKDKETTMECLIRSNLVDGESEQKYIFKGINDTIKTQELYVDLEVNREEIIEDYERILKEDSNCSNIIINGKNITYKCNYDLTKNHYYSDIEDKNGNLSFSKLKDNFESNDFICNYK